MPPGIHRLIQHLHQKKGSDLHLSPGHPVVMRVRGELVPMTQKDLSAAQIEGLTDEILTVAEAEGLRASGEVDLALEVPGVARARANVFATHRGRSAVLRLIPQDIPSLDDLGLPEPVARIADLQAGLVLVTGPTGSGKSTTLAALVDRINRTRECHLITIEDPIEFVHPNRKAVVTQRAVGIHAPSFAEAIRAAGREDPDAILVGEMRDLDTISQALTSAEFGILVLGTLHTNSAAKTIDRIVDSFPSDQQYQVRSMLSESLKAVVAQQLLPTVDGQGRCAALEVLVANTAVSNLIREGKSAQIHGIMQSGGAQGMQTMEQALARLVTEGKVDVEAARRKASNREAFERALPGGGR